MWKEVRMSCRSSVLSLLVLSAVWWTSGPSEALAVYTLEFGPFASQVQVAAVEEILDAESMPQATSASDGVTTTVMVGCFEYVAEAYVARKAIDPENVFDASVVALAVQRGRRTSPQFTGVTRLPRPFFQKPVPRADQLPVQSLAGNATYDQLKQLDKQETRQGYRQALQSAYPGLANTDPMKGYVAANLGIQAIVDKDHKAALEYLLPVANGEIASAADHRVMAMNRAAWLTHWKKDRLRAYRAYREVQDFTTLQSVRDSCEVECIGLLMELAESGRGTHEEVRAAAAKALTTVPETNVKSRATIELMNLETYARQPEPDFAHAAALGEAFLVKYKALGTEAPQREFVAATFETGLCHQRAGNLSAARTYFTKVIEEFPASVETFNGFNPKAQALHGLALIARAEGDFQTERQILRDILQLYPEDGISKAVEKANPTLRDDTRRSTSTLEVAQ
jgi:tetratricopeptide (TPR) repeat protein